MNTVYNSIITYTNSSIRLAMTDQDLEQNPMLNNPLHGVKLETLLEELVQYYGWEILAEYTRIRCFEKNVSMASSLKFLRKTEWAREKLERFYLYNFKNLPKADDVNFELPPRKRIIPAHQKPREPVELILGEAPEPKPRKTNRFDNTRNKRPYSQTKSHTRGYSNNHDNSKLSGQNDSSTKVDPWAACREDD